MLVAAQGGELEVCKMKTKEGIIKIGSYEVQILELARNKANVEFFPVLIDAFDGDIWRGINRVYVDKTMSESALSDLLQRNPFVVEQLFGMTKNQKVTLVPVVDIIKH